MEAIKDLCMLKYLKEAVKECDPFDGWEADEMLQHYIGKYGFNPKVELKLHIDKLYKKYLTKEIKAEFEYHQASEDLDTKRLGELQILINGLDAGRTVEAIIYELFMFNSI